MKTHLYIAALAGLLLVHSSCTRSADVENAINNIVFYQDPADWVGVLSSSKNSLERYRAEFGLPEVSSMQSKDYSTVLGVIAQRCAEWDEWELAVEYSKAALELRNDPAAQKALIRVAIESENQFARDAVQAIYIADRSTLPHVDLLIAQGKFAEAQNALTELGRVEANADRGSPFLTRMYFTNRALLIAKKLGNSSSFDELLRSAWAEYFISDDELRAFCQKNASVDRTDMGFVLAIAARDIAILAYQKYRAEGNSEQAAIWQVRATLLAEAVVAASPGYSLHYQRVVKARLK